MDPGKVSLELKDLRIGELIKTVRKHTVSGREQEFYKGLRELYSRSERTYKPTELYHLLRMTPDDVIRTNAEDTKKFVLALVHQAGELDKESLVKFMKWVESFGDQPAEMPLYMTKLASVLLSTHHERLTSDGLLHFLDYFDDSSRTEVLKYLFNQRDTLNTLQLLQLMKHFFPGEPSSEIMVLMNAMYKNEAEKKRSSANVTFGLIRPYYHHANSVLRNSRGKPPPPSTIQNPSELHVAPLRPSSSVGFNGAARHVVEVSFNLLLEQKHRGEYSNMAYGVTLLSEIDSSMVACVYLSVPPYDESSQVLIGYLTREEPLLPLRYPLPVFGSAPTARLAVELHRKTTLESWLSGVGESTLFKIGLDKSPYMSEASTSTDTILRTPPKSISEPAGVVSPIAITNAVTVCNGETHSFRVDAALTCGELLERCCRRWALNPHGYELQDEDYQTLGLEKPVVGTLNTQFVRVVPKRFGADAGPIRPAPLFGAPPRAGEGTTPGLFDRGRGAGGFNAWGR